MPLEITISCLKNLLLKYLIRLSAADLYFNNLIKKTPWDHLVVKLKDINAIKYVTDNYNFMNYDFRRTNITDDIVTDDIVKKLHKCYSLNLSYCEQLTVISIKKLGNCHTINVIGFKKITDDSVNQSFKKKLLAFYGKCKRIT